MYSDKLTRAMRNMNSIYSIFRVLVLVLVLVLVREEEFNALLSMELGEGIAKPATRKTTPITIPDTKPFLTLDALSSHIFLL